MAGDQKGEITKDEKLLLKAMNAQLQQKMKPSFDKFRQEFRQQLQQATGHSLESRSSERRQRREHEGRGNSRDKFVDQKIKIPPFFGDADPAVYVEWEEKMEKIFNCQHYAERKKVLIATAEFYGYALSWWKQLIKSRRLDGKEPVETWLKLRSLMRREYVPRQYYKEVLQRQRRIRQKGTYLRQPEAKLYSSDSVHKQQGSMRSSPTSVISLSSKTTSRDSKEDIKELSQLIMDVGKPLKRTNTARPYIEAQHQEPVTTVSEIKVAEPDSAASIQEAQTETSKEKEKSETEQDCSLFLPQSEFNFNNSFDELTCLEPVQPSSLVSVSQVTEEVSAEQEPEQSTQREDLEQQNSLQSETIPETLSYDLQEHCKEFNMVVSVPEMFVKVSIEDIKRFGLDKVKDFCVSKSVFDNMFKSFKELKPEIIFDQKRLENQNNNISGHILSFDHFLKHGKSFDHFERVFELKLKQSDCCFRKPCDSLSRTEEKNFVMNFPMHKLVTDNFLASTYVLKESRKCHEPKLHHAGVRFEILNSANISEFEIDCLCAENIYKRVGLFFDDILVYNTFFDKHIALLKREINGSGCIVLYLVNILVYNTFFDMITHLTCPKEAEKVTGQKRSYNYQSINDESLAKLEAQQANLESCLAASLDIGAVRGSYLNNHKELINKLDCYGNLTHPGLTSNWNLVQSFSG
ncbi:hypothetical protein Bca4012_010131 [Brassica carinata]